MPDESTITSGDIATAAKEAESAPASPAAHPQSADPHPPASATATPATEPPAAGRAPAAVDPSKYGPVPFERHEAILGSTRREYEERLGRLRWAEAHDPDRVRRALELADQFENAPQRVIDAITARQPKRTAAPAADARDERGEPFYSASQAAALARHVAAELVEERMRELDQRIAPIETARRAQADTEALTAQISEATTWPGFMDSLDEITAAIVAANRQGQKLGLHAAYVQLVAPKLAASREALTAEIRKAIVAEYNNPTVTRRAEIDPARPAHSTRKADAEKSTAEMLAEEYEARKAG